MHSIKFLSFIIFIPLLFVACNQGTKKLAVVVPMASSGELNVRVNNYERAISKHSLANYKENAFNPSTTVSTPPVKQFYMPIDKKNLPSIANQKRIALVIGNSDYINAGRLANPVNDARGMAKALTSLGFKVLEHEDLGQSDMKRAIDEFGSMMGQYDVSLVFYAGHGIQVNGNNYLIPVDAKISSKKDVEYNAIDAGRILSKMEGSKSKTNIIILDACRNNPFERSWNRAVRLNGKGSGLAFMNAPAGSLIAYSTAPGSTAADGEVGTNGVYTSALLEHIKTPNITIEEMFKRVRLTVEAKTNKQQTSWESTSLKGNFFFKIEK
ncbi:Mlr3463 protein [hydrothermal vent metagenome]|uniref:Mlr3463 protein n=1 Tax=hydrothermal vent metagenome TaxID=652676 RepID=A0A1W1D0Y1_9ZZZZ